MAMFVRPAKAAGSGVRRLRAPVLEDPSDVGDKKLVGFAFLSLFCLSRCCFFLKTWLGRRLGAPGLRLRSEPGALGDDPGNAAAAGGLRPGAKAERLGAQLKWGRRPESGGSEL